TMEYNRRGHQLYQMLAMSATTGNLRTVVEERSNTFVNYSRLWRQFINDGKQLLWTSERDNWNHIYLYDVQPDKKGHLAKPRQITRGDWFVRRVENVDEQNRIIYFAASGVNKDEDPYLIHYYKIGFDGKGMTCLTPAEGNHSVVFSPDHQYLVDTYSKVDTPPVTELRSASDGHLIKTLEKADISQLKANGWVAPEVFKAKGRDGQTDMWGIIQRPTNFDPSKKYPVIEYIYAGPGDAYTPKSFIAYNWNMTALAELGFIVVQLDAMGTSYRGKKFEEICYKNLKDAGFPDRELWIKAAAAKYPYMDADNVGIFGASAGGQESTTAVLLHGDFYKAAYSSCGCHDNRMDKIWWNEQWMGWPIDSSYVECSNVYNAHKLERPLMLVVGELDDNVDPSSTYQVVNALEKAGKDFDLVVLPGVHHTLGEQFGEHKRYDFFVKNLLHVNPPKWSEVK
ncbi:MAG TPA: S9 family peptidase, partial [Prevotella sp.]|nr:S9 family peptidase [Prevotella sp.]